MPNKLAIIMSGGGMSCSYGAGVTTALIEKFNIINPDIVIARSGSAGTGSYFISKQYDSIKNIWQNLLSNKKFINPLRILQPMDIDYLIDIVFKKQDPLNVSNIYNSNIQFFVPATNSKTGEIKYFNNKDNVDWLEVLRATKALPPLFNKTVTIDNKKYFDVYGQRLNKIDISKAVGLGATKIIVIDNENRNFINNIIFSILIRLKSRTFWINYYKNIDVAEKILTNANIDIIYLTPKKQLKVGPINNNQKNLQKVFRQGFDETINNKDLISFLN